MSMAMIPSPSSSDPEGVTSDPSVALGVTGSDRPPSISRLSSLLSPTDYSNLTGWAKLKAKARELFTVSVPPPESRTRSAG